MYETGSFSACELLLKKHARLWLKIDDDKPDVRRTIIGKYVPKISDNTVQDIKYLKNNGISIGEIARKCKVSWRTAWKYSRTFQ